ncbi:endonuclease V-like isoform X1 [Quercus lobata]|uniref:endonuclease V-like isoform X1 n=1 Tax=Quercus lobata TaxID=97700 RepID=UPI0012440779|nr:endonuclease V-like isoform X1 [Quercus lobata]XP_030945334.1 endonuclease V-like isoform X1 [Quercus lobata]XP_030945335.1 endonuclease V-like isoform X1 [Quercus lobata]
MEKAPETGIEESSSPNTSQDDHKQWIEAQDDLKRRLVTEDDFSWKLSKENEEEEEEEVLLRYVGGVDISFSKEDTSVACGTLVVLDMQSQDLQTVYHDHYLVTLTVPYVPGFLAFREAPVLLELLERMKKNAIPFYPQVLMVDGNGILHPRGFGLACHLGVLADLPTIGIGKNLHHVDGLTYSGVRQLLENKENCTENFITLSGCSGKIWGVAMRSTKGSLKPIFISVGHRVSLDTAITIVKMTCKYRVPEPTRQADIRSREYLRKHQTGMSE